MDNPYASPSTVSKTKPPPVARQQSLPANLLHFAVLAAAVAAGCYVLGFPHGIVVGAAIYVTYSFGSRMVITRAHRRGMRYCRNQQYEAAIAAYEESYAFFTRHAWIDRFRSIVFMSPSAFAYRDMALCNIGFCYAQLGDGVRAERYYQRALDEFPDSVLADAALRMVAAFKQEL
jgi:tetratricopeptide (TPR) repeat protein